MIGRLSGAILTLAALAAGPARSMESPGAFYSGKTLEILVGAEAGAPRHTFARIIGRHLARYLPGSPSIAVRTKPGADGRKAARWLFNNAADDGSVIGALDPDAILAPLLADEKTRERIKYDPQAFNYLGSASSTVQVCIIRKDSPARTFEETRRRRLIMGASREGGPTRETPRVLANVLGARFRMVDLYRDTAQAVRGMEEGEVHGICGFGFHHLMTMRPDLMDQARVDLLLQYGMAPHPDLVQRGVPQVWGFTRSDSDRDVLKLLISPLVFAQPYVTPPAVPRERIGVLRSALARTLKDPDFRSDARKARLDVVPTGGREVERLVHKAFSSPSYIVERARAAVQG